MKPEPEVPHVAVQIDQYANHLEKMADYTQDVASWRNAFQSLRNFVAVKLKRQKPGDAYKQLGRKMCHGNVDLRPEDESK